MGRCAPIVTKYQMNIIGIFLTFYSKQDIVNAGFEIDFLPFI